MVKLSRQVNSQPAGIKGGTYIHLCPPNKNDITGIPVMSFYIL